MSQIPLESAKAKIARGLSHLQNLRQEEPASVKFIHEQATDELAMYAVLPPDAFMRLSVIAGEVIHHTRSALEHAVWELVPPASQSRQTSFPVYESKTDYSAQGSKKIQGINSSAATIIENAQPFGARNELWELNKLWNRDKHTNLNTFVSIIQGSSVIYQFPDGRAESYFVSVARDIRDGSEIFRRPHPGADVKVLAEVAFSDMRFVDEPFAERSVVSLLTSHIKFATKLIDDLAATT